VLQCVETQYCTRTRDTRFGNTAGLPVPVLNPTNRFRITCHRLLLSKMSLLSPIISLPLLPTHPILVASIRRAGRPMLLNANLITHSELQAPTSVKFQYLHRLPGIGPPEMPRKADQPCKNCAQWRRCRHYKPLARIGLGLGESGFGCEAQVYGKEQTDTRILGLIT
jgi:hypothetical protein